jgi:hypothetical protein
VPQQVSARATPTFDVPDFKAASTAFKVEAAQFYRDLEPALAVAQRAKQEYLSTALVRKHRVIFVGDAAGSAQHRNARECPARERFFCCGGRWGPMKPRPAVEISVL